MLIAEAANIGGHSAAVDMAKLATGGITAAAAEQKTNRQMNAVYMEAQK